MSRILRLLRLCKPSDGNWATLVPDRSSLLRFFKFTKAFLWIETSCLLPKKDSVPISLPLKVCSPIDWIRLNSRFLQCRISCQVSAGRFSRLDGRIIGKSLRCSSRPSLHLDLSLSQLIWLLSFRPIYNWNDSVRSASSCCQF